ncbi:uncharacterized protein F5147DRAFT_779188 [Suillus discolor]|uniref:Uncharacterized protein n=1 Tax=Suillus discolor TaxID=1912936 RepID=A0A9P7EXL7_9AGAM|nr:uncharacterized protein F5147DRAFT_779188 [Suillus discolor]KAG2093899.1 hypothetical protein F5147DRAFT_779188 [Suillus discolor]
MARPPIYKTDQAKLEASLPDQVNKRNRDSILQRWRELRIIKPSQEILEIQKALAEALGYEDDATASETEADDDENDQLFNLPECLLDIKNVKDEMLALVPEPCAFTEGVLLQYVKSLPDDGNAKGDTLIVNTPKLQVEALLHRAIFAQDQIMNFCGVSAESRAAESVSHYLNTVLGYLEDIQYYLDIEGISELTIAHSMEYSLFMRDIHAALNALEDLRTDARAMAPRRWASPEEEEFVYMFYEQYQQCQARRDYSTFWKPFYEAWGAKFPEWLVVFPDIPLDEDLNGEQKQIVSKVYEERKLQLMHKLRNDWGSSKALCKAKNNREKTCASLIASITAPQRACALQSHEAYSKLYFATRGKPTVDAEMQCLQHVANLAKLGNRMDKRGEKDINDTTADDPTSSSMEKGQLPKRIAVIKRVTRELYDHETPEVKAEVAAYIEQLNEKKSQDSEAAKTGEDIDHQVTIDQLVDILAEFFQELERLTGWSFSVLMGGPTPALGGKIDVSSFHVGCTEMGNLFSEAYPHFNSTIMKPWVEFVNRAHPTAAAKGLRKDGGVESMNDTKTVGVESIDPSHTVMNHHVTNTSEQNPAMSDSSNLDTTALLPPLDESDELNILADAFLASPEYSQHQASASSSNTYSSINPYDDFSWMPLASQPSAETSEQGKTYAPGLFLPQPSPQLPQPSPQLPQPSPQLSQPSPQLPQPSPQLSQPSPQTCPSTLPFPPLSTMNSTSPTAVSILMPSPVDQSVDSPDASLSVPPPHTSKRRRHHDSNKSEISDALVAGHSKRVRMGSKCNDIANSIGQDTTKLATQRKRA